MKVEKTVTRKVDIDQLRKDLVVNYNALVKLFNEEMSSTEMNDIELTEEYVEKFEELRTSVIILASLENKQLGMKNCLVPGARRLVLSY